MVSISKSMMRVALADFGQRYLFRLLLAAFDRLWPLLAGGVGVAKMPNIGIFKMPPKIVVILVLGTPKHLELGPILRK